MMVGFAESDECWARQKAGRVETMVTADSLHREGTARREVK